MSPDASSSSVSAHAPDAHGHVSHGGSESFPEAPHDPHHDDDAHLRRHLKLYLGVFGALLVFTLLTVWAAGLPISPEGHIIVALLIASVKASLVAGFFMHLTTERPLIHQILAFTFFFFLGMVFLCILAWADHTGHIVLPGFPHGGGG